MTSRAAPTSAVDADRLYVFFESGELAGLDHDGNVLWERSLAKEYGTTKSSHGLGSSLAQTDAQRPAEVTVYGVAAVEGAFVIRTGQRLVCVRAPN